MHSAALALLVILVLWHSQDVLAAVRECGDNFLIPGYVGFAAVLIAVSVFAVIMLRSARIGFKIGRASCRERV